MNGFTSRLQWDDGLVRDVVVDDIAVERYPGVGFPPWGVDKAAVAFAMACETI